MILENPVQNIETIKLDDLILWSENPREPIGEGYSNDDIIEMAVIDENKKWRLKKLLTDMGSFYYESDLPTVVERDGKYIVYDGNRRIVLIKFLKNPAAFPDIHNILEEHEIPEDIKNISELPCNVCNKETALYIVCKKHVGTASWGAVERDIFNYKHMGEEESDFLIFDEATGLIDKNKKLNQGFVKTEVLTEANMNAIGFSFKGKKLQSVYDNEYAKIVLHCLATAIKETKITTRERLDFKKGETLKTRLEKEVSRLKGQLKTLNGNENDLSECEDVYIGKITFTLEDLQI